MMLRTRRDMKLHLRIAYIVGALYAVIIFNDKHGLYLINYAANLHSYTFKYKIDRICNVLLMS